MIINYRFVCCSGWGGGLRGDSNPLYNSSTLLTGVHGFFKFSFHPQFDSSQICQFSPCNKILIHWGILIENIFVLRKVSSSSMPMISSEQNDNWDWLHSLVGIVILVLLHLTVWYSLSCLYPIPGLPDRHTYLLFQCFASICFPPLQGLVQTMQFLSPNKSIQLSFPNISHILRPLSFLVTSHTERWLC